MTIRQINVKRIYVSPHNTVKNIYVSPGVNKIKKQMRLLCSHISYFFMKFYNIMVSFEVLHQCGLGPVKGVK